MKILIVEDDLTMEPLWRYVIETAAPGAELDWMTSGEGAEAMIARTTYDLIIADIFLTGTKTGLDLWHHDLCHQMEGAFILMSVLTPQRLAILNEGRSELPSYLQKPLDPSQCIETVKATLAIV